MRKNISLSQDELKKAKKLYVSDAAANTEKRAVIDGVKAEEVQALDTPKKAYDYFSDRVQQVKGIFRNGGFDEKTGEVVSLSDALNHYDAPIVLPKVMDEMLIEPIEPLLNVTRAFTVISGDNVDDLMAEWPALSALEAEDMAPTQEYGERALEMEGGFTITGVGKVGVGAKIAQETIEKSRFDLVALHLRAMGAALARKKEVKSWAALSTTGQTLYDNYSGGSSVFGTTTGIGRDGSGALDYNGAITGDDIFKAWGHSAAQGFPFSVMYVHPLAWTLFARDPLTRQFALAGLAQYYGAWQGQIAGTVRQYGNGMGVAGGFNLENLYTTAGVETSQTATGVSVPPSYLPIPLTIIPTPFAYYDAVNALTDIIAVNPGNVGVIVQRKGVTVGSWEDPAREIVKMKASESYGYGTVNGGLGVYTFKGIKVDPNSLFTSPMVENSFTSDAQPSTPPAFPAP